MDHITVGDLRAKIADLPDDMLVLRVDSYDDAHVLNKVHVDVVKEKRPGFGYATWVTPEEFKEFCDDSGTPMSPYSEKDRPPADGVLALTLWS